MAFPSLFVSHGAPNVVLRDSAARAFFLDYGRELIARHGKPRAILALSAHFEAPAPTLSADPAPGMIYDFSGFEPELNGIVYPAPGDPALAEEAAALLKAHGMSARILPRRGFDHGTWAPLTLLLPDADIPVTQAAIVTGADAAAHYAMGEALAPLREDGVLILGSGTATHNLREILREASWGGFDASEPSWVDDFARWLNERIEAGAVEDILDYRRRAPFARENHPSEDHFLPLPFAMGAGGRQAKGTRIHASHQYGAMRMDAYAFQ